MTEISASCIIINLHDLLVTHVATATLLQSETDSS